MDHRNVVVIDVVVIVIDIIVIDVVVIDVDVVIIANPGKKRVADDVRPISCGPAIT